MSVTPDMSSNIKNGLIQAVYQSRLSRILPRALAGCGAILTLHRIKPEMPDDFQPNSTLEVTPAFLDQTIRQIRDRGLEIISLDEMHRRLMSGETSRRFVCLTLDDGYIDNYTHALPVFEKHQVPFSIFLTTGFLDQTAVFWWLLLEKALRQTSHIALNFGNDLVEHPTSTVADKTQAYRDLHQRFRSASAEDCMAAAGQLMNGYHVDAQSLCREESMTWAMAHEITAGGLGTIEAHTVNHIALTRQDAGDIRTDMEQSCARIEEKTGRRPGHFAYPFGDTMAAGQREFELLESMHFLTASTMRDGMLREKNASALTALPRLALNGLYQSPAYVDLLLSGLNALASSSIQQLRGRRQQ